MVRFRPSLGRARTGDFKINANAPICIPLRTVNIQISKPYLPHALSDNPCFFVPRDADFVSIVWLVRGVEGVDEEEVVVRKRGELVCWFGRRGFEVVEEGVVVLVLVLYFGLSGCKRT